MAEISIEKNQALINKPRRIKRTQARPEIAGSLASLANYEQQMAQWLNPKAAHRFSDSLDLYCFETLVGHHHLDEIETAKIEVGFTLYDTDELKYLSDYCLWSFSFIVNEIGETEPDEAYYGHPEWPRIVYGAIMCRRYMAANNLKHEFWREFDEAEGLEYTPNDHQFLERDKYFLNMDVAAYMYKHWPSWQVPK